MISSTETDQGKLMSERYGGQEAPDVLWNDTIRTLVAHRSVRAYLPTQLPEKTIETLVAAAQSASTSSNLHQWSVIAVTDQEVKTRCGELARLNSLGMGQPYIDEAPLLMLWVADMSRTHAFGVATGKEPVVVDYLDTFMSALIDASLAAQNAIVAAESLGLGTVCIGAMRNNAAELAEYMGLPQHSFVAFGLVVGYEDKERPNATRPRPRQQVMLHRDRYQQEQSMAALDTYDEIMGAHYAARGTKVVGWRDIVAKITTDVSYLDGREKLSKLMRDRDIKML